MYLSRLLLNPHNRLVHTDLARPYEMHRTLMRAFPDNLTVGDERLLYRIEAEPRTELPLLLVQSQLRPTWERLADTYLTARDDNPAIKDFAPRLTAGQVLAFRLAANPTKRLSAKSLVSTAAGMQPVDPKMIGKRIGLYTEAEQVDWLARKAEQNGFQLLSVSVRGQDRIKTTRPATTEDNEPRLITLQGVTFDGMLRTTDPARLLTALTQGIGSGKAFGFGLLSLAPAHYGV